MRSTIPKTAAARLAQEARSTAVDDALSSAQKAGSARVKPGDVTMEAFFVGIVPDSKKAKQQAAEGQADAPAQDGGGGGGGGSGKARPARIQVLVTSVVDLAREDPPAGYYRVMDHECLMFYGKDEKGIKKANESLVEARKHLAEVERKDPVNETEVKVMRNALVEKERKLKELGARLDYMTLSNNEVITMSTFDSETPKGLSSMQRISLVGFHLNTSTSGEKTYIQFQCRRIVKIDKSSADTVPVVTLMQHLDIQQLKLSPVPPGQQFGRSHVVNFSYYEREDPARGPVLERVVKNSTDPTDYIVTPTKEGAAPLLAATWRMMQRQAKVVRLYSAETNALVSHERVETYEIVATAMDGSFAESTSKNILRKAFGIMDTTLFSQVMSANAVPCIAVCSEKLDATRQLSAAAGDDEATIVCYINAMIPNLRGYLLEQCPRVTLAYARTSLGIKPDVPNTEMFLNRGNVDRPCLMNLQNTKQGKSDAKNKSGIKFAADKVVCLNYFTGSLSDLLSEGPEIRVLLSAQMSMEDRVTIATLSDEDAVKCLRQNDDAKVHIEGDFTKVFYAVLPWSAGEVEDFEKAEATWKERAEHALKVQAEIDARSDVVASASKAKAVASSNTIVSDATLDVAGTVQAAKKEPRTAPGAKRAPATSADDEAGGGGDHGDDSAQDQGDAKHMDEDGEGIEGDHDAEESARQAKKHQPVAASAGAAVRKAAGATPVMSTTLPAKVAPPAATARAAVSTGSNAGPPARVNRKQAP